VKAEIYSKKSHPAKLPPNLADYEKTYQTFDWKDVKRELSWFEDGKINAAYNAVDRHGLGKFKNKVALYYVPEEGEAKEFTFWQLQNLSNQVANILKKLGIEKGQRVFIFLPRIPELYYGFLGIIKTGAVAGTLFQAFGPSGIQDRLGQSGAVAVITNSEMKERIYKVKKDLPDLKHVIIVDGKAEKPGEVDLKKEMEEASVDFDCAKMEPEDYAFMLYTSGCCHSDSLIQLADGQIKTIKEIVEKDKKDSLIANVTPNPFKQVKDRISELHKYHWSGDLYEITASSFKSRVTPNHVFFTLNQEGEIVEKQAQQLDRGDYIFTVSKIKIKGKKQHLPPLSRKPEYKNSGQFQAHNLPRIPNYLTPNFAQILGYLAGDGHLDKRSIIFTDKERGNLRFYQSLVQKELGLQSLIRKKGRQRLLVNSTLFREYINNNFSELSDRSSTRNIPSIIQKSDNQALAAFLRGLFDAEGCIGQFFIKFSTTSQNLAYIAKLLLNRFGIISFISSRVNRGGRFGNKRIRDSLVWELMISERNSLIQFKKEINFSSPTKQAKFKQFLNRLEKSDIIEKERYPISCLLRELHSIVPIPGELIKNLRLALYGEYRIGKSILPKLIRFVDRKIKEVPQLTFKSWFGAPRAKLAKALKEKFTTLRVLKNIRRTLQRLDKLEGVILEKIKDIEIVKNDSRYVYDLTALKNHTYLANGVVVHNTTGKPKGVMHSQMAILQEHLTAKWVLDIREDDIYWCTADPGWVTGIAYEILGSMSIGASTVIFGGKFDPAKWYAILQRFEVTVWYTAPTALRMLMKAGEKLVKNYDLSKLRFLGSVGEPLNPEVIRWGLKVFGLPFHDNWWQTETGAICIANYSCMDIKLGSMGRPVPGIVAGIVDDKGNELPVGKEGNLALKPGWPSMMASIWRRPQKYESYFVTPVRKQGSPAMAGGSSFVKELARHERGAERRVEWYITGDRAIKDKDGYFWFIGRADDVIKTSGERVGPFEVESAIIEHPACAEAGVIGKPDPERGEIIKAFVVLKPGQKGSEALKGEISEFVKNKLAGHAYPREVEFVESLPKTRSGKIMRRVLKAKELGLPIGDTSTLEEY
jgi:acetyl-CoA synthetase